MPGEGQIVKWVGVKYGLLEVFHKAGCKSAVTISATKNLIRYNTRNEAIQAGKKPCAECNP